MKTATLVSLATALLTPTFLPACRHAELTGPPEIHLGRDACSDCGMIISEDRCCCSFVVDADGSREHLLFDDIGCMLDTERRRLHGRRVLERYVRDHESSAWAAAGSAIFLFADPDKLQTPMGSGMVAFAARPAAELAARTHGGTLMNYTDLLVARRTWMEARYGKPDTPDSP